MSPGKEQDAKGPQMHSDSPEAAGEEGSWEPSTLGSMNPKACRNSVLITNPVSFPVRGNSGSNLQTYLLNFELACALCNFILLCNGEKVPPGIERRKREENENIKSLGKPNNK